MSTERIAGSVYDHATLYDVLFSDSCRREVGFVNGIFRKFDRRPAGTTGSFFEPACGTGRLLFRLARQGHDVAGLDLNPHAVEYCNRRLRRHGLPASATLGDMTAFTLSDLGRRKPFDLAFNFVSSFLHLTTEDAAVKHLQAVGAALKPGAFYLLGLHLLPCGEARCSTESWSVRRGRLALRSRLRRLALDRRRRIETVEFRIRATTPRKNYEVVDTFPLRTYTVAQFRRLLQSAGCFDTAATFDFSLDRPVRLDADSEDVVFVLRKR